MIAKTKRLTEKHAAAERDILNLTWCEASSLLAPLFNRLPELVSVSWLQGTPSFNDGAPCLFGVYMHPIDLNLTAQDGTTIAWADGVFQRVDTVFDLEDSEIEDDTCATLRVTLSEAVMERSVEDAKIYDAFRTFVNLPSSWFEYMFGNNSRVVVYVTPSGELDFATEYGEVG